MQQLTTVYQKYVTQNDQSIQKCGPLLGQTSPVTKQHVSVFSTECFGTDLGEAL